MPRHSKVFSANCPTPGDAVAESWSTNRMMLTLVVWCRLDSLLSHSIHWERDARCACQAVQHTEPVTCPLSSDRFQIATTRRIGASGHAAALPRAMMALRAGTKSHPLQPSHCRARGHRLEDCGDVVEHFPQAAVSIRGVRFMKRSSA